MLNGIEPTLEKPQQACLICAFRYLHLMGKFIGISPLTSIHNPNQTKISYSGFFISGLCCLMLLSNVYFNFGDIANYDLHTHKLRIIYLINDTIYVTIAGICSLISLIQIRYKIMELNGLFQIIQAKEAYGMEVIFNQKHGKIFYFRANLACFGAILACGCQMIWELFDYDTNFKIFRIVATSLACYVTMMLLFQFIGSCHLYCYLFEELLEALKVALHQRDASLVIELRRLRRLYASYIFNLRVLDKFYNPTKIVLTSLVLVSMVVNFYLIIMSFIEDSLETMMNLQSLYKLIGTLVATIWFFGTADQLKGSVSKIYSHALKHLQSCELAMTTSRHMIDTCKIYHIAYTPMF